MGARCAIESPPPLSTITSKALDKQSTLVQEKSKSLLAQEAAIDKPEQQDQPETPDIKLKDNFDEAGTAGEDVGSESSTLPLTCSDSGAHSGSDSHIKEGIHVPVNDSVAEKQLVAGSPVTPNRGITLVTRLTSQTLQPGGSTGSQQSNTGDREVHATIEPGTNTAQLTMEVGSLRISSLYAWEGSSTLGVTFSNISA